MVLIVDEQRTVVAPLYLPATNGGEYKRYMSETGRKCNVAPFHVLYEGS